MSVKTFLDRKKFEETAYPISERSWYRYRKILERSRKPFTPENIQALATLSKQRYKIDSASFNQWLKLDNELGLSGNVEISGVRFLHLIQSKYGIILHRSTVSKWFKPFGGYDAREIYNYSDIKIIALNAAMLADEYRKSESA
jgi:hypothetical protein